MNKLINYESPQGAKTENVIFRLTKTEKQLMFEQAKKRGISVSALIRYMLSELSKKDLRFN